MRTAVRRAGSVAGVTAALLLALATAASAETTIVTADPCPPGYKGVIVGSDATGSVFVCENIV